MLWKIQNYADCAKDAVGIVTVGNYVNASLISMYHINTTKLCACQNEIQRKEKGPKGFFFSPRDRIIESYIKTWKGLKSILNKIQKLSEKECVSNDTRYVVE